jgi:hypothetical protein
MSGDSRRESRTPVAIERLSELIPEIDSSLAAVGKFVNACFAGEHSDLSRLEAFDAEFYVQQLYERMALARGYVDQLGIGPDAESLLREAEKLRDDVHDYGVELVKLADAAKGDAAAEADVLQASGELHDRAIVLNLDLLAVEAAYGTVKDLFARFEGGFGPMVEELRARLLTSDVSAGTSDGQLAEIGFLGGTALADALGIHATRRDAFFRQLERQRISLGDDCWHEVREPRPNSPRFLYRVDSPKLRDLAAAYKNPKTA